MDPLDKLLQDIKDEVEGKKPATPLSTLSSSTSSVASKPTYVGSSLDVDDLLSEGPLVKKTSAPLSSMTVSTPTSQPKTPISVSFSEDPLIAGLREELGAEEAAAKRERARQQAEAERFRREEEERQRLAEAREARRREEEARRLEQQRREALAAEERRYAEEKRKQQEAYLEEAKRFLATLKPKSKDAQWFEKFAENYPSRLDAALAYVQSLDDVGV